MGVLKLAEQFLPRNILKNLRRSMVEPHFRHINRLQKLQNRAVRIITNSAFDTPAKPLLANLGLRSISKLNENQLKLMFFNSLNDLTPDACRYT